MPTFDRYNGTTKEQRKMARAVAADVLEQIKVYRIKAGRYYTFHGKNSVQGEDIKSAKPAVFKKCEVCARGAMFLSRARLFNVYKFPNGDPSNHFSGANAIADATEVDFGLNNASLIEAAFECAIQHASSENTPGYDGDSKANRLGRYAVKFGRAYRTPRTRLKAIMQNVIANKGVFRPDKEVSLD